MREGEKIANKWFLLFEAVFYIGEKKLHVVFLCLFVLRWIVSVWVDNGNEMDPE